MVLRSSSSISMGTLAPNFLLSGTDGASYSLDSFDQEYLVILFICNHCPYILAIEDSIQNVARIYTKKGVGFVGISANDTMAYPQDSFEEMKKKEYVFPYLYDESQDVAKAYDAQCTPDIYVYDKERTLVYHGRFDDSLRGDVPATTSDLTQALDELLANGKVISPQIPSQGCSIKWKK